MTKHRLMLSAATAALLAGPIMADGALAQTTISSRSTVAHTTSADGDLTIDTGGAVAVNLASPAVTLNSNNLLFVNTGGTIANTGTDNASGVRIDTSLANIVSKGFTNIGTIDLTGSGAGKVGVDINGPFSFYGPINLAPVVTTTGAAAGGSSILVAGDSSTAFLMEPLARVYGDITLGGSMTMVPSQNSVAPAGSLVDLEGFTNGNVTVPSGAVLTNTGNGARGLAMLGSIKACDSAQLATVGQTCAANSTGVLAISGTVQVGGTQTPSTKDPNPESGSAVLIAGPVAGGLLIDGPKTSFPNVVAGTVAGNGVSAAGGISPVLLIDSGASVAASFGVTQPLIMGPVQSSVDAADGFSGQGGGFSFINRGTIIGNPIDADISATGVVIQGQSTANYTCLSGDSASCVTRVGGKPVGGFLNTGQIRIQGRSLENTNSSVTATALTVGGYATVPRIVVSGQLTSGSNSTPGVIQAAVSGPGGGVATAISIAQLATVSQIDVMQRATVSATIVSTSIAPTSVFANSSTPFIQTTAAIRDLSGTLTTVNNAGSISALTTQITPGPGAITASTQHAIDLLANTLGGITINNSGSIQGDILFGAAGNGNTLNVGNTGTSGTANTATGVTNTPFQYATISGRILATPNGAAPTTETNVITFGSGTDQALHVGGFGYVNSVILSQAGALDVTVDSNGQLFVANTSVTGSLQARRFDVNGGVLGLSISQGTSSTTPVVLASQEATLGPNARIGLQFGTFISSGTTAASVNAPTTQTITLISAPAGNLNITDSTLAADNAALVPAIPFLFESPAEAGSRAPQPLTRGTSGTNQTLLLNLLPRSPGATNADGTAGLGLSGDAYQVFPYVTQALANDPTLGAALASSLTVTNGVGATTINVAASQLQAQEVFSQFTPDVTGGTRQVAITITDQATGPVAARQRLLRDYAREPGELTLWASEFAAMSSNKGKVTGAGSLTAYKNHGWGFSMGMDAGSPRGGWYGGALTFYSSDVSETIPRATKTSEQWYMLSGYTDWRGRHVFLDTKLDIGYGSLTSHRGMSVGNQVRDAVGKRASLLGAIGGTGGVFFNYGAFQIVPHVSLDGLTMREEGYAEANGGAGLNLDVAPYYANSLRLALGSDFKSRFSFFGINMTPEARFGYRYDLANSPVKLKAAFLSTGGLAVSGNTITFVGPDPDSGNILAGASLSGGTESWSLGVHFDWLRGNNGSTTQIGTLTLLGRI